MEYFGSAHLPYALLAIAISFIFVALPFLLLVIYPCRCFHKCLNYCGLRSQTLHIFMDAFQGSYKTEPRDLRYFSAFYLLLRLLMLLQVPLNALHLQHAVLPICGCSGYFPALQSEDSQCNRLCSDDPDGDFLCQLLLQHLY